MAHTDESPAAVSTTEKPKRQPSSRNLDRKFSTEEEEEESLENNNKGLRRWVYVLFCFFLVVLPITYYHTIIKPKACDTIRFKMCLFLILQHNAFELERHPVLLLKLINWLKFITAWRLQFNGWSIQHRILKIKTKTKPRRVCAPVPSNRHEMAAEGRFPWKSAAPLVYELHEPSH